MIIWLASYPKSGNTLLRAMLSAYLFSDDGKFNFKLLKNIKQFPDLNVLKELGVDTDDINNIIKNSIRCQEILNNKNMVGFLKTHTMLYNFKREYAFTNLDNTLGAVYIVRDPRNVVSSYARHLDLPIDEVVKFITAGKVNKLDFMGNWSENYTSWKGLNANGKYLLIKYEDLISMPEETFEKVLHFIHKLRNFKFSINKDKFYNVIKSTSFANLKKLEEKESFFESVKDKKGNIIKFFDQGSKRDWVKSLDKNLSKQIEEALRKEMLELGYL